MMVKFLQKLRDSHFAEEGFTLVELMIVVVIIGILAAVALPVFASQQATALASSVKSDVRSVSVAVTTLIVKVPSAVSITGDNSDAPGTSFIVTADAGGSGASAQVEVVVSDAETIIVVSGDANVYHISGFNESAKPNMHEYTSYGGKITERDVVTP